MSPAQPRGPHAPALPRNYSTADYRAPAAPVITTANPLETTDATPTVAGTAEAGATVRVYLDGGIYGGPVTADADGVWSFTFAALADGSYSVTATATDAAGNTSGYSLALAVELDTTAPDAPVITTASPLVTTDTTPEITGTAEALSTVTVLLDGVASGLPVMADGAGGWSFVFAELDIGEYQVTATATDQAGNASAPSDPLTVEVAEVAPPLLDVVGSAVAAWSVARRLSSSYMGNAYLARRTSDGATQAIGFDGDRIDTDALLAFSQGGEVTCQELYSQHGETLTLPQGSAGVQPILVTSGGALVTRNGRPSMRFDGSRNFTSGSIILAQLHNGTAHSIYGVAQFGDTADPNASYTLFRTVNSSNQRGAALWFDDVTNSRQIEHFIGVDAGNKPVINRSGNDAIPAGELCQVFVHGDADATPASARSSIYVNAGEAIANNVNTAAPSTSSSSCFFVLGGGAAGVGSNLTGYFSELVIWPSQVDVAAVRGNGGAWFDLAA